MSEPLDSLAERLDDWVRAGAVSVTENAGRLVVRRLTGTLATELLGLLDAAALDVARLRDAGGDFERAELDDGMDGVQIQATLPAAPLGVDRILTLSAFANALTRSDLASRVWVRRLDAPFETLATRFGPWDDDNRQAPVETCVDPRRVMRALGTYEATDADLCRWLLIDAATVEVADSPAYRVWRARAAAAIARALSNEIDPNGVLLFRGPPVSRFTIEAGDVEQEGFLALQRAGRWTYLNANELDQRHALMAAEIARTALRSGDLMALSEAAGPALEGARIAYAFGVQQQSRESLKALSDLRKAVLDEAAKLTEINRGLATAVGTAVLGGVGLLVARLTLPNNGVFVGGAALLLGIVLVLHVGATILNGMLFVRLQRRLRKEWRSRLYAFLGQADYEALVEQPVGQAENGFWVTAWAGGVLTFLVAAASMVLFMTAPARAPNPTPLPSQALQSEPAPPQKASPSVVEQASKSRGSAGTVGDARRRSQPPSRRLSDATAAAGETELSSVARHGAA